MYAVMETGGKQYKVEEGSIVRAEKLEGNIGDVLLFDKVMSFDNKAIAKEPKASQNTNKVEGKILSQGLRDKVLVFKKRRRQNSRRLKGHRQTFTEIKITKI